MSGAPSISGTSQFPNPMYTFDNIALNSSCKICREYQNTHFVFNIFFLGKLSRL
jgi:hypothetical protein